MDNDSTHHILCVDFHLISYEDVFSTILDWRKNSKQHYIALTPPYSVLMCYRDNALKKATKNASLTLPDGVGIILSAIILRYSHHGRVTGPSLMLKLCDFGRSEKLKHFFYGSTPDVINKLTEKLMHQYPELDIVGSCCPPFHEPSLTEDIEIVRQINEAEPDIVWVGLGSPKQEKWMAEHINRIKATVMIGVGAAFDFHSGHKKWAPAWMRKLGFEWAYRLAQEPRRMWQRNVGSFVFLVKILHQRVRGSYARRSAITLNKIE